MSMAYTKKPKRADWWDVRPPRMYRLPQGDVACCDALLFLSSLRKESADIIFLDPPFNLGKHYGRNGSKADSLGDEDYSQYITQIIQRSVHVLKNGGSLYMYHLPRWAFKFANVLCAQLTFRHWIAVSMKNGFPGARHLYPAHYSLLYFTKGEPRQFRRPKIKTPKCRHCNSYVKDYGGYERFVRRGINLSDVWEDVSPVRHKKYKHRASNELPPVIPRRVIQISGRPGAVFVDPFAGAGTALVAAKEARMRFVACDSELSYCKLILKRLAFEKQ